MLITADMNARQISSVQLHETNRRVGAEAAERGLSISGMRKLIGKHYGPVREQIEDEIRQLHSAVDVERLLIEIAKLR